MKKILIITPRFESIGRGVEVFAKYLAGGLDPKKYAVTVLSGPHNNKNFPFHCVQFPLWQRNSINRYLGRFLSALPARLLCSPSEIESLSLMIGARKFLKDHSYDVIFPFGGTWTYRFARRYFPNAKIIAVGHAGPVKTDLNLSNYFVALTPVDEDRSRKMAPNLGMRTIPNGVDLALFKPTNSTSVRSGLRRILCVGAYSKDKHQDLLLDALAYLGSDIECILAGAGPEKSRLEQHPMVKSGRVQFIELVHDEMPIIYQSADVFTLPAPTEAFGLVFLEALATGLPVVAHDAPRQRFVIGDAGLFCNVLDPKSYASALNTALTLPYDEARVRQAEKFTWHDIIRQYEVLLDDLSEAAGNG